MLDNDTGRNIEGFDTLPGRICIRDIVVGKLLSLQLRIAGQAARSRSEVTVESSLLVGVLPVAQVLGNIKIEVEAAGKKPALASFAVQRGQIIADGAIVSRRMRKGFARKPE